MSSRAIDATSSSEGWENATLYVRNSNSNGGTAANIAGQGLPRADPAELLPRRTTFPAQRSTRKRTAGRSSVGVNSGGAGEVFSVQGNGDIHQAQTADGAVKAAVNRLVRRQLHDHQTQLRPGLVTTITIGSGRVAGRVWLQLRVQDLRPLLHREPDEP